MRLLLFPLRRQFRVQRGLEKPSGGLLARFESMLEAEILYLREKCVVASRSVVQAVLSDLADSKAASQSPSWDD